MLGHTTICIVVFYAAILTFSTADITNIDNLEEDEGNGYSWRSDRSYELFIFKQLNLIEYTNFH